MNKWLTLSVSMVAAIALAVLAWSASSKVPWCDTESARNLRLRDLPVTGLQTVDRFFADIARGETMIFAHRGGYDCQELDSAPENSLPNVEKAIRMGFRGFETDLWRTNDGQFIIHHDGWLGRTTFPPAGPSDGGDRSRAVERTSFDEIRELRLKYPSGDVSSEKVPTLGELLRAGKGRILFLVELKGDSPLYFPEILSIVENAESSAQVLFWVTWRPEFAEPFQDYLESGITEVSSSVVWRVGNRSEFDDVVQKFDPRMIDLKPDWDALRLEKHLHIQPREHASLVEHALKGSAAVLVSRVSSDSYLQTLHDMGVRVFMSRAPERHLALLLEGRLLGM
jgi:hypothetical protein